MRFDCCLPEDIPNSSQAFATHRRKFHAPPADLAGATGLKSCEVSTDQVVGRQVRWLSSHMQSLDVLVEPSAVGNKASMKVVGTRRPSFTHPLEGGLELPHDVLARNRSVQVEHEVSETTH